jgi:GAF domain-containing protein/HAMP domain-containing protein
MSFRFSLSWQFYSGFAAILVCIGLFVLISTAQIRRTEMLSNRLTELYLPSSSGMADLSGLVSRSTQLAMASAKSGYDEQRDARQELTDLKAIGFLDCINKLHQLKPKWEKTEVDKFDRAIALIEDSLFPKQTELSRLTLVAGRQIALPKAEEDLARITEKTLSSVDEISQRLEMYSRRSSIELINALSRISATIMFAGLGIIVLASLIGFFLANSLVAPVDDVKDGLIALGSGLIPDLKPSARKDEIGDMQNALKELTDSMSKLSDFAQQIGKGNYRAEFIPLGSRDVLGNSLISLKDSLESASKATAERQEKDRIANWITNGLASFSELLRKSNNISVLAKSLITELVNYMGINQGGIFIINDDDKNNPHLEMAACFAYGRDRYSQKRIEFGEGIVGTAYLEKETVVIADVPDGYTDITSGLGEATPSCILVVPLKTDDNVLGVMELAAFHIFKEHEISFAERIATSIATTIANVKVAEETSKLLDLSNLQTKKMKDQEDLMKQNIEELEATQEEAAYIRGQMENQLRDARLEIERLKETLASHHS